MFTFCCYYWSADIIERLTFEINLNQILAYEIYITRDTINHKLKKMLCLSIFQAITLYSLKCFSPKNNYVNC